MHEGWGERVKASRREKRDGQYRRNPYVQNPLLSTLTSSSWRAFMAYTRDSIRFNVLWRGIRILREIRDLEIVDANRRR